MGKKGEKILVYKCFELSLKNEIRELQKVRSTKKFFESIVFALEQEAIPIEKETKGFADYKLFKGVIWVSRKDEKRAREIIDNLEKAK